MTTITVLCRITLGIGEDFAEQVVHADVPMPPFGGGELIRAYEVENSTQRLLLNAWATEHIFPLIAPYLDRDDMVESLCLASRDVSELVGCEFTFDDTGVVLG